MNISLKKRTKKISRMLVNYVKAFYDDLEIEDAENFFIQTYIPEDEESFRIPKWLDIEKISELCIDGSCYDFLYIDDTEIFPSIEDFMRDLGKKEGIGSERIVKVRQRVEISPYGQGNNMSVIWICRASMVVLSDGTPLSDFSDNDFWISVVGYKVNIPFDSIVDALTRNSI